MMIDHMTLTVGDIARSRAFYEKVLATLGYRVVMEFDGMCGFGEGPKPYLWMKEGPSPTQPMHIAFAAKRRADVNAFYAAALGLGAEDNGAPGIRPDYHPTYYGAFVIDPDGHPIEAVCHHEYASAAKRGARRAATARRGARKAPARKPTRAAAKRPAATAKPGRKRARA